MDKSHCSYCETDFDDLTHKCEFCYYKKVSEEDNSSRFVIPPPLRIREIRESRKLEKRSQVIKKYKGVFEAIKESLCASDDNVTWVDCSNVLNEDWKIFESLLEEAGWEVGHALNGKVPLADQSLELGLKGTSE